MSQTIPPVLIVDLVKGYGGAEVRVLELAKSFHGHQPYAVAALADAPLHQRLKAANLNALPVPYARSDPRTFSFLRRVITKKGYGIVDAHNVQSQFWGHLAASFTGARKITTLHSAYKLEHQSLKGRAYEQVLRLNNWLGVDFIVVSEAVDNYLQSIGVSKNKISLIHNSLRAPEETSGPPPTLLKELGWDKEDICVVIIVARLEPVKAHNILLEALAQVKMDHPQIRCLIVGDGRTRPALEEQVAQLDLQDRVYFAGFRNDIPQLLKAADIFCLPSLTEGLPFALLEASAHHLPLLVSNVGGMADLLTHQENAYLIPPSNVEALANGLRWLVDHPQETAALAQAATDLIQQKFSPEKMIAETLAVYQPPEI